MTTTIEKAQVSLPSEREVRVVRKFKAPRELVYRAYTEPELVQRWLEGPGWSMPVCEMDVRVGGSFRWRWRNNKDGKEFGFYGVFREVNAPANLLHEENYEPGDIGGPMPTSPTLITTVFSEQNGVTTITTTMLYPSKEARDGAVSTGMTDGMEISYQQLDALLAA
jgi:uncharacterized protein YndB with AHSA1/START domain